MRVFGYARVSTDEQSLDCQLDQLKEAGADQVFREKLSGARGDRPQLLRMIATLQSGDIVLVTRLDRFARSTRDLLNCLAQITERGAHFRSIADPWVDTASPHGRLMVTVLGGLAEFERELIRSRTSEGRKRAQARGVKLGRPRKLTPFQIKEAAARASQGVTLSEIARSFNVAHTTVLRSISRISP